MRTFQKVPRKRRTAGLSPAATAVAAICARMTTQPSTARKAAMTTFVQSLMDAGIWSLLDGMWVAANQDRQSASLNWVQNAYNLPTTGGTFTVDVGLSGGSLSTGFVVPSNRQNNGHLSTYLGVAPGVDGSTALHCTGLSGNCTALMPNNNNTPQEVRALWQSAWPGALFASVGGVAGLYAVSRSNSLNATQARVTTADAISTQSDAQGSGTPNTAALVLGGTAQTWSVVTIGQALTNAQLVSLEQACRVWYATNKT